MSQSQGSIEQMYLFGTEPVTIIDKLRCAERELKLRQRVYANRVLTGRMKQTQADYEIKVMAAIVADYKSIATNTFTGRNLR